MSDAVGAMPIQQLLSPTDPNPFEIINKDSTHPLLLVCEHAGQAIPSRLRNLGISNSALDSHIGWDIGAANVTRQMARTLNAPAVLQRYSRLVIDCNRPADAPDAMPEISDGIEIPGNHTMDTGERTTRITEIFEPYQKAVEALLRTPSRRIVLSIHSFTQTMNGQHRPWEIGFLFRKDTETSRRLGQFLQDTLPDVTIGLNEPYQIDDASDWFVPQHGEVKGIPHSLIEIRNDQIDTAQGQSLWAGTLVAVIERYLKET
jgi:predicted N-formylglutamate amidohydrolase